MWLLTHIVIVVFSLRLLTIFLVKKRLRFATEICLQYLLLRTHVVLTKFLS